MKKESVLNYLYRKELLTPPVHNQGFRTYLSFSPRIHGYTFVVNKDETLVILVREYFCFCCYLNGNIQGTYIFFKDSEILSLLGNWEVDSVNKYPVFSSF